MPSSPLSSRSPAEPSPGAGTAPSRRWWRRAGAIALIAAALAAGLGVYLRARHRPNVVFIIIDTLRADHVGAYGSTQHLTPHLDAVAAESLAFEKAYATSAWTKSSIASMFTGYFPSRIGVLDRDDAIPDSVDTLAELLRRNGYQTHGVTSNGNAGTTYGFAQGFDSFGYPREQRSYPGGAATYPANGITHAALEWLGQRQRGKPFFLFLHYADPHDPYFPHPEMDCGEEPPGRYGGSREALREMDAAGKRGELTEADKARIRYLYACDVKFCDHWIGELVNQLRRQGLWENTLVIITADHGEGLWDHDERAHGRDLYDEMVHVPLLVKYPGRVAPARIQRPVSLVDLAPTVLAATGTNPAAPSQGSDLRALLAGDVEESQPGIYSELALDWVDLESLRTPEHTLLRARKLAIDDPDAYRLFDRRVDPGEKDNIARRPSAAADAMKTSLRDWRAFVQPSAEEKKHQVALEELSPVELKSLRDLGYISDAEYRQAAQRRAPARP
jgi:arylsulfatase A-like enzyme